ncbi:MAG: hypothetical protein IJJ85_02810 [Clostridia bacterium]|nr:hypothetical protein [Clostridia bacterium]
MKKSSKVISLILAIVMVFSVATTAFAAENRIIKATSIENLIQNNSLGDLVGNLITNINNKKADVTGTVLRLVYLFLNNDDLNTFIAGRDVTKLSDADCAKILLDWLDKFLPEATKDITSQSWYGPVSRLTPILGITLDLKSVNGIIKTVYSVCDKADDKLFGRPVLNLGIANDLNGSALKNLSRSKGDLNVIYGIFQWITDNLTVIKKAVNGNLDLGIIGNYVDLGDTEDLIKDIPNLAKSYIYLLIDGKAEGGKFKKGETKGDWGNSAYAGYSADEMLAAALIRLINNNNEVVPQADAKAALDLSFYGILAKYAPTLYANFAVKWINDGLKTLLNNISVTPEIKAMFNLNYTVDEHTFDDIFQGAGTIGFLGQLNNILVKISTIILSADAQKSMTLVAGGNDKLNENLTKIARFVLPLMNNDTVEANLNFKFDKFTAESVKTMELKDMAVAILKPFFSTWFGSNSEYSNEAVASADTLEQLAALAIYYTATNTSWLNIDYDFAPLKEKIFDGNKVKAFTTDEAKDAILSTAAGIGIGAMKHNKASLHFDDSDIDPTNWKDASNKIQNWGLNFIKGIPAVAKDADLVNANDYGPFYKLNVVLNELIDFSFLNGAGDGAFKLSFETLLDKVIMDNVFNFDIAGLVGVFEANTNPDNILNQKFIPAVISLLDRIVASLFSHPHTVKTLDTPITVLNADGSKTTTVKTVCAFSGHYVDAETVDTPVASNVMIGDVNKDGSIGADDARLALRRSVDLENYEEGSDEFIACDVNADKSVGADDARQILRASVDLEDPAKWAANAA